MWFFLYNRYEYSFKATVVSFIGGAGGLAFIFLAVEVFRGGMEIKDSGECARAVLWAVLGVIFYYQVSKKLAKKIAEKEWSKKVRDASFCYQYALEHPEYYDKFVRANKEFAAKYVRTADGKIVRRQ